MRRVAAVAVETHEASFLAEDAGKLVHDATINATIVVLCSLSDENQIPLADLVVSKEVVQTESEAALKCC